MSVSNPESSEAGCQRSEAGLTRALRDLRSLFSYGDYALSPPGTGLLG